MIIMCLLLNYDLIFWEIKCVCLEVLLMIIVSVRVRFSANVYIVYYFKTSFHASFLFFLVIQWKLCGDEKSTHVAVHWPRACGTAPSPPPRCWRWAADPAARPRPTAATSAPSGAHGHFVKASLSWPQAGKQRLFTPVDRVNQYRSVYCAVVEFVLSENISCN